MDIILTRYLYLKDEVELMCVLSLIHKRDTDEAIFWFYELFMSGFERDTFRLLYKIYFDFYATLNPKFLRTLDSKCTTWHSNDFDVRTIGMLVTNMIKRPISFQVFAMRQCTSASFTHLGRKPNWLHDGPYLKEHFPLILSIHRNELLTVYTHILALERNGHQMFEVYLSLIYYFKHVKKVVYTHSQDTLEQNFKTIEEGIYGDTTHFLLALVVYLNDTGERIPHKNLENKQLLAPFPARHFKTVCEDNIDTFPLYDRLIHKRRYGISQLLGAFVLKRGISDQTSGAVDERLRTALAFHWVYYASTSPLWASRLDHCCPTGWMREHATSDVTFTNIDDGERFVECWSYEHDELPLGIQQFAIRLLSGDSNDFWDEVFHDLSPETLNAIPKQFAY